MTRLIPSALALAPVLALMAPEVTAQRTFDQDKMKANYAAMQEHQWFTGGAWITDFAVAKAQAEKTGKPIFAYFTRTYSP